MVDGKAPPDNGGVEGQFEDLLSLVLARSRGEVGNDAVENALNSIVSANAPPSIISSGKSNAATSDKITQPNKETITPDDGNYDDDGEDDIPSKANTSKNVATKDNREGSTAKTKKDATLKKKNNSRRKKALEIIPLGKMGERMIITFGDGPCPNLDVISSSLLGTRASLQRAIHDARALRRQLKDKWHQARAGAIMHRGASAFNEEIKKTSAGIQSSVLDSELSFRAMDGFSDSIRFDVPCGFDVTQLTTLFPEEMGAYSRWKKMHDSYKENDGEDVPKKSEKYDDTTVNNKEDDELELETAASVQEEMNSGRLNERLANFDARTTVMGGDGYLQFADIRKGSFLPRAGRKSAAETEERKKRKCRGRPTTDRTTWNSLGPPSVIFLHWIGFDPRSALSPPNEETTQALGFLAYDFFGEIVEKAVSLRLNSGKRSNDVERTTSRSEMPLLELTGGDQLEKGNVDQALTEVDLSSLYSSSNIDLGKSAKVTQLYFGPGFEDRLELEMDELFGSKKKSLTKEEMKARMEEENLFSELPQLPTLFSSVTDGPVSNNLKDESKEGEFKEGEFKEGKSKEGKSKEGKSKEGEPSSTKKRRPNE